MTKNKDGRSWKQNKAPHGRLRQSDVEMCSERESKKHKGVPGEAHRRAGYGKETVCRKLLGT